MKKKKATKKGGRGGKSVARVECPRWPQAGVNKSASREEIHGRTVPTYPGVKGGGTRKKRGGGPDLVCVCCFIVKVEVHCKRLEKSGGGLGGWGGRGGGGGGGGGGGLLRFIFFWGFFLVDGGVGTFLLQHYQTRSLDPN